MQKLDKRWKIILYGCSGLGVNMLNMIVGSYLCSALLIGGFDKHVENWTYLNRDLVVAGIWATLILVVKVLDGFIDIPLSNFTDNLRTRWGRRRPAIVMGFIPMVLGYLLFLVPINNGATLGNTLWFAAMLGLFYCAYTLTMLTYYATFAEIIENDRDRVLLSNTKSICDVVYYSLSFALVPVFVSMGVNIRAVALIFLPLALTMVIPLFLIKEKSTRPGDGFVPEKAVRVNVFRSFILSFKNRDFIVWLGILAVMNIGLQLFLSGINEFFSTTGLDMTFIMASAFAPIPFTLMLYNYFVRKKGMKFAYQYALLIFSVGMLMMFACPHLPEKLMLPYAMLCGVITSFGIGSFFSVIYIIPSQLAADENARSGICASSMYFAVQGIFEAVAAGFASGPLLVFLKQHGLIQYTTGVVALMCMTAFVLAFFMPRSIATIGKEKK
ncbi:MAG: MFS transporter [Ruminococcaceae bacterium]|nr:MFS transporter [Oscillospiraceae bacterium]